MSERIALIIWTFAKLLLAVSVVATLGLLFTDLAIAAPITAAAGASVWLIGRGAVWVLTGD
jgi:hypothetical protein